MKGIARLAFCGALATFLFGPARPFPLHGQNRPAAQQPTFKTTTALVEVDVIVLDNKGKFVPGLVAEDLALFEDGKPQSIQQFYMVTHEIGAKAAPVIQLTGSRPEDRAHRVFVFVFDEGHLAHDSLMRVKVGAEAFIRAQFGPGDVGGVFVNGGMYKGRLTTDKGELIAAVRTVKPAFENRQELLAPFREFPRIPGEVDAARIADGARELVDALGTEICREDPVQCRDNGGEQQVENLIQQKARLYVRQARMLTAGTVQNLQSVIGSLSSIPGRKTVVLMSEGFFMEESRSTMQSLAAQAARSGMAIYSIDGRGNINSTTNPDATSNSRSRSLVFDTGKDGPTILTEGTGGFMIHGIDDISRAFNMIEHDTSTYYVIGYQPENTVMDGKYRKIEVKTRGDGLKVRARRGYAAVKLPPLVSWTGR